MKIIRKPLQKEDIIDSSYSPAEGDYLYKIKNDYKQWVIDWVRAEKLWIKNEIE